MSERGEYMDATKDNELLYLQDRRDYFILNKYKSIVDAGREHFLNDINSNKPVRPSISEVESLNSIAVEHKKKFDLYKIILFACIGLTILSLILSFLSAITAIFFIVALAFVVLSILENNKRENYEKQSNSTKSLYDSFPARMEKWENEYNNQNATFDKYCDLVKNYNEDINKLKYDNISVPHEYDNIEGLDAIIELLKTNMADNMREAVNQLEEKKRFEREMAFKEQQELNRHREAMRQVSIQEEQLNLQKEQIQMQKDAEKSAQKEKDYRESQFLNAQSRYNLELSQRSSAESSGDAARIADAQRRVDRAYADMIRWK